MTTLNINSYRAKESQYESLLPNRMIEAFSPAHFEKVGYPVRLKNDGDVIKYVDAMHERRHDAFLTNLFNGGLTDSEFMLLSEFIEFYWNKMKKINKDILPIDCLLNTLHAAVPILKMSDILKDKNARVFEIGPGSGYLTAMLAMKGLEMMASDICEAFYLTQHQLYSNLFPQSFVQLATHDHIPHNLPTGSIAHLPWWLYVDHESLQNQRFDIIAACHCVTEMHPWAFKYFLKISSQMLSESKLGYLVIDGWGSDVPRKPSEVMREAYSCGWKNVYSDGVFTVLKHDPENSIQEFQTLPWESHGFYDLQAAETHSVKSWRPRRYSSNSRVASFFDRKEEQSSRLWAADDLNRFYKDKYPSFRKCADADFFEFINFFI